MRTLIDLPQEDVALLNKLARAGSVSRAELVRQAVSTYLAPHRKTNIRDFLGICPEFEDGMAYQDRLRSEWER